MGRPENPVDPGEGPVQGFAHELRLLRQKAGGPSYRAMARETGLSVTVLSQAAAGRRLPSLPVLTAYVRCCAGDEAVWRTRWQEVSAVLAAAVPAGDDDTGAPYRGLLRFEPSDEHLFFGRDRLVAGLLALTARHRLVVLLGPSGSGKSSLIRAGLVPRLRRAGPGGPDGPDGPGRPAALRLLTPGAGPLRDHAHLLEPAPGAGDTWLIVDQFEEVFTLCADPDERTGFLDALARATRPDSRLRVLLVLRADFYAHCLRHPLLAEALREAGLPIGAMRPAELREAVVGPAAAAGLVVERALTARLVEEAAAEPGSLPMLSHALLETWRRRRGRTLTVEAYEAAGGLHGAVAQTAEAVHRALPPRQADLARRILLRLVAPGEGTPDTRRPGTLAEVQGPYGVDRDRARALEALVSARLVTVDDQRVDLAHEALITGWPRLAQWVDAGRERLRLQRDLTQAAHSWERAGHDDGALHRGALLTAAARAFDGFGQRADLSPLERRFLDAGLAARTREEHRARRAARRTRAFTGALVVLLVLAVTAAATAWQQNRSSAREQARGAAHRLVHTAEGLRYSDPRTARLLSIAAWRIADAPETRSALAAAAAQPVTDSFEDPYADAGHEVSLGRTGETVTTVDSTRVRVWNLGGHRLTGTYRADGIRPPAPGAFAVSPDAGMLAVAAEGPAAGIRLWDIAAERAEGGPLPAPTRRVPAFGAGGRLLTAAGGGRAQVWEVGPRRLVVERPAPGDLLPVTSPDGRLAVFCGPAGTAELWDLTQGRAVPPPWQPGDTARHCTRGPGQTGLAFGPDSRTLALSTGSELLRWDLTTGAALPRLRGNDLGEPVFSADGRFLAASAPGELLVWRLSRPDRPVWRYRHPGAVSELRFDAAGRFLRFLAGARSTDRAMPVKTADLRAVAGAAWEPDPADAAQLSADGRRLARARTQDGRGVFEILDAGDAGDGDRAAGGRVIARPPPPPRGTTGSGPDGSTEVLSLSADGTTLAYGYGTRDPFTPGPTGPLRIWSAAAAPGDTGELPVRAAVSGIRLTPDARTLLVASTVDGVQAWDVAGRAPARTVVPGSGETVVPADIAVRPDGKLLVTSPDETTDLESGRGVRAGHGRSDRLRFAFSPSGGMLAKAASPDEVELWNSHGTRMTGRLTGPDDAGRDGQDAERVTALAFSPDGRLLAVAGEDGSLRLWDVAARLELSGAFAPAGDGILSLAFTADGSALVVAGRHVPLRHVPVAPRALTARLCDALRPATGTALSPDQWHAYVPELAYRDIC
ncbi:nSTAND1 domain-containing NTPase [Streptomyces lavendulae]|uniref:nSTAND1 domain-containing NTPase n=1 Tax=Streptomyces lavendulae TaxID=1914 RepID=UPI00249F965E|nr:hypothetical protein [Streptomyces lavendulae]GLX19705.1 hypothetical protein Slala01_33490 [Streptomyces lavendulae subsp. lavendulae]GLX27200.1 hypothetical protein Slala02_30200 [Streptomyces lavendulae subsp. lavendulae]